MLTNEEIAQFIKKLRSSGRIMTGESRMEKLKDIFLRYKDDPNAFVECGVAKGGCLAMMKYLSGNRKIWGFDSFEGMPQQTIEDNRVGNEFIGYRCSGNEGELSVRETFDLVGLKTDDIILVKGWFEDTLSKNKENIGKIVVLRIDGDWYKSVQCCLNVLYDSLIDGGTIIVDDYNTFPGCKQAVDEFRRDKKISSKIDVFPGGSEICWTK